MCCVLEPAILSSTILLAHQVEHEGKPVNVIGYQNSATSRGLGPNAMVIPIPSAAPMSQANCVDMTGAGKAFREYEEVLRPKSRGMFLNKGGPVDAVASIQVFDSGSYTVLLTRQVGLVELREALKALPEGKRIELDVQKGKIFAAYKKLYPEWHIAICVWNGHIEAEPILWWYEPRLRYVEHHFLPGLDAHDGNPPDPGLKSVPVDHTIVVGAPAVGRYGQPPSPNAADVVGRAPEHLRKWLPVNVFGGLFQGQQMRNGDWVLPKTGWDYGSSNFQATRKRVAPPGYAA